MKKLTPFEEILENDYFKQLAQNYKKPLLNTEKGIDAIVYALTPLAVARTQRAIIEAIITGDLKLDSNIWNIIVVERDVPCAYLAVKSLNELFSYLYQLKGENKKLPKINLQIYNTNFC